MPVLQPIESNRLLLREIKEKDFDEIYRIKSDPEVVKYLTWGPFTEEQTLNSIKKQIAFQDAKNRKVFVLAVILKDTQEVIGNALLMIENDDVETAEIGYFLHSKFWNRGLGKEVVECLIHAGFKVLNLYRIYAQCDVENVGSSHILKKMGFRLEGHFHKNLKVKGNWRDNFLFALLREEYIQ
ncbi:GNAT family N-acetyltransferase [Litchfieldia alkalitelluris]|uniref:GNAT family N-acetyltransferase n=1 Tax=Litchfieldia alkalitelluris TaxID=304268 RepID=UPI001474452A|nr:GNAT family N-acetyltransferase [Litchfieldia alkalitelluris]